MGADRASVTHGIGVAVPRLSWWLPLGADRQLAYRIRADNGWDSGRIESSESVLVDYAGPPLLIEAILFHSDGVTADGQVGNDEVTLFVGHRLAREVGRNVVYAHGGAGNGGAGRIGNAPANAAIDGLRLGRGEGKSDGHNRNCGEKDAAR